MKYFYSFFFILVLVHIGFSQTFNRPVPPVLFPYEFDQNQPMSGYYLTAPTFASSGSQTQFSGAATILDSNGYIAWYYQSSSIQGFFNFKYFPLSKQFGVILPSFTLNTYYLIDSTFTLVDSLYNVNGYRPDPHEFIQLSNGNYMIAAQSDSVMDLSAYTFNGTTGSSATHVYGFVVQEFDANHNLVFEWNSNDYIAPTEWMDTYPYNPNGFDYCHGNAISEAEDGNLLISFRHLNAIYKIDHTTGDVIWKLGGQSSDFTLPNDTGFSGQHDVRSHSNQVISIFDNANSSTPPVHSRAVEFQLDTIQWTATKIWEYFYSPPFFTFAMGNHQITAAGNHLIDYGISYRPDPSFILVNDAGDEVLSAVFFQDSVFSYRSYIEQLPFNIDRPTIQCNDLGGAIELSVSTQDEYLWSTGESTSSILVTTPGTYQVWVNKGVGMVGSYPITINDMSSCTLGVPDLDMTNKPTIIGTYDLLGRKVDQLHPGQMYIQVDEYGQTHKIMGASY